MPEPNRPKWFPKRNEASIFWLIALALSAFYLGGTQFVPFHPDESTYLFMSVDFEALWRNPTALIYSAEKDTPALRRLPNNQLPGDVLRQRYRALDAPLTRYLVGVGLSLAGQTAPGVDWDWSLDWESNRQAGALPSNEMLLAGRLAVVLLLPFSMLLLYASGRQAGSPLTGLLAVALLGINGLVMLHTRRAMAEGALVFCVALALYGFIRGDRQPWLAGLGAALAFNAKHSALALFPVGLVAVCWLLPPFQPLFPLSALSKPFQINWTGVILRIKNLAWYCAVFFLVSLALNPLWWSNPAAALRASWEARQDLASRQAQNVYAPDEGFTLGTATRRSAILLANLTIAPLAFSEVGNYREQTASAEQAYLANPLHSLLRGVVGGGVWIMLAIVGFVLGAIIASGKKSRLLNQAEFLYTPQRRRALSLLALATLVQSAGLIVMVALPWQRYVMPVVPLLSLWAAFTISIPFEALTSKSNPPSAK
jgi:4-amino-4-deoxy-L-arabinose transferase-like glycosyltransferase